LHSPPQFVKGLRKNIRGGCAVRFPFAPGILNQTTRAKEEPPMLEPMTAAKALRVFLMRPS